MCIRFDRDLNTRAIQLLEHPGRFIEMSTEAKRKYVIARALVTDPPVAFAAEWFGSTAAESGTEPQLHFAEFDLVASCPLLVGIAVSIDLLRLRFRRQSKGESAIYCVFESLRATALYPWHFSLLNSHG